MKSKALYPVGIIFVLFILSVFSVISAAQPNITITEQTISIVAYPGDFAESLVGIKNNQDKNITVTVERVTGKIVEIMPQGVDRISIKLAPGQQKNLRVRGYIPKEVDIGIYKGELLLMVDKEERRIPLIIEVSSPVEEIMLDLRIHPIKTEYKPGEVLEIQADITNLGRKSVDIKLEIQLIDVQKNLTIVAKTTDVSIATVMTSRIELELPKKIEEKEYSIKGIAYYVTEDGKRRIVTSADSSVMIKRSIFDVFSPIIAIFTPARIQLILAGILALVILYFIYLLYKQEKIRRKRYLESIKFETLPKAGHTTGFIGKVAETKVKAYIELNNLQTHTLIAGTTGCGKTIVAQILAEEALLKGRSVIVFDPTAQWTGFLKSNRDAGMLRLYGRFDMKRESAIPFKGNIYSVKDPNKKLNVRRHINPGEITIFYLKGMDTSQIETFIANTVNEIFQSNFEESPELKLLLIYDEVHRILPKFGGSGIGFLQIERATREFRKWGIGLVLISQVLKDFIGATQANIGTEIQMQTRYGEDLNRIKLKYGAEVYRSVVKSNVGTGMLQNSEYNKGMPYFVSFRPILHSPIRLSDEDIELYSKYNSRIDSLRDILDKIKAKGVDIFDLELELNLAQESVKSGTFEVVDLYLNSLAPRIQEYYDRVKANKITKEDIAIRSDWDENKKKELKSYELELGVHVEKEKKKLDLRGEELRKKEEEEKKRLEEEKRKLLEKERRSREELEYRKKGLKSESHVLGLIKDREILREEIKAKEEEKLRAKREELKKKEELQRKKIEEDRVKRLEKERKLEEEAKRKRETLEKDAKKIGENWQRIAEDKKLIQEKDRDIGKKEDKWVENVKGRIQNGIEKQKRIIDELVREKRIERKEELKRTQEELERKLEEEREKRAREGKEKRREFKSEKDRLQAELHMIKEKWRGILDREKKIRETEWELERKRDEWNRRLEDERRRIEELGIEGEGWEDLKRMDEEWKRMDELKEEKRRLEEELENIRKELRTQKGLRYEEEKEMRGKVEELRKLRREFGVKEAEGKEGLEELYKEAEVRISPEKEKELMEREKELEHKKGELFKRIGEERERMAELTVKGEGWEDLEMMEKEWRKMDELRKEKEKLEEELNEIKRRLRTSEE